jgi:hypothetical protein
VIERTRSNPAAVNLRGRGVGILVCAGFGALWACSGLSAWPLGVAGMAYAVVVAIAGTLAIVGIGLVRNGRRAASARASADLPSSAPARRTGWWFTVVLVAEIIAMNILAWLLVGHDLTRYLLPGIAIIVGLHFYPLAWLFRAPHYRVTATLMTLAGLVGVAAMLHGAAAHPVNAVVDGVCALTLWTTGFVSWRRAAAAVADSPSGAD